MKLTVTIDTEEDNWGEYSLARYSAENVENIPELQELFDHFNVKPTYFVSYPVASDSQAVSTLKSLLREGKCEIGMHCHPWNTPPLEETLSKSNMILYNLLVALRIIKLKFMHQTIIKTFNTTPISFRAGQWGYDNEALVCLQEIGYRIDSSVTPYTDWSDKGGGDLSQFSLEPYYLVLHRHSKHKTVEKMLEVPVTIGFTQNNVTLSRNLFNFLRPPLSIVYT